MEESKAAESLIEMNRISEDKENNKDKTQDADTTKQRIQKRKEQSPKTAGVLLQKIAQQLLSGDSAKAMELLHHCGVDAMMVDVMKKRGGEKFEVRIPVFGMSVRCVVVFACLQQAKEGTGKLSGAQAARVKRTPEQMAKDRAQKDKEKDKEKKRGRDRDEGSEESGSSGSDSEDTDDSDEDSDDSDDPSDSSESEDSDDKRKRKKKERKKKSARKRKRAQKKKKEKEKKKKKKKEKEKEGGRGADDAVGSRRKKGKGTRKKPEPKTVDVRTYTV